MYSFSDRNGRGGLNVLKVFCSAAEWRSDSTVCSESRCLTFTAVLPLESRLRAVARRLVVDQTADSSVQAHVGRTAEVLQDLLAADQCRLCAVDLYVGYPSSERRLILHHG